MSDVIQLLPDAIANQIAAGEVVQRPASVVKELLENAIDAGATEVQLMVENAGKTFIQVQDNGKGMSTTDARMCFERHATSKIKKVDDLFDIHTFGFRGEAMASIGAVAKVHLKTKREEDELGTEINIEDSKVHSQQPIATKTGTCTTVKNLFFNVPARKNFLKSNKVEQKHITNELIRVALTQPSIAFKYVSDKEVLYDLKPGNFKKRVVQLFGKQYESNLIDVNEDSRIVNISGFVASPELARKTRGDQYFLANGRFVKSPYFNHSIMGAFDGLLPDDSYPAYFLKMELSPSRIDVNVHPTKTEVKFEDEKAIYSILQSSIRKALNDFHVAPVLDFDQDKANLESWMRNSPFPNTDVEPENHGSSSRPATATTWIPPSFQKTEQGSAQRNWQALYEQQQNNESRPPANPIAVSDDQRSDKAPFQVANKYIASAIKSGLMLIHQNRAHQRVLYEQFRATIGLGKSKTQRKLFPEVVQLNAAQFKALSAVLDQVNALGFDLASFGNNALIVNGVPEEIGNESAEDLVRKLADDVEEGEVNDSLSLGDRMAKSLARSAAIKTGKSLNTEEMKSLINQLFACQEPYFGISGGTTIQVFSTDELDSKFA